MKRVLFYTDTPLLGGAENQMLLLAKFLDPEKYSVTLACSSYKNLNIWCQKFMELGINVIRVKVAGKHDPRHLLYLKKILKNFDLLHLHIWNPASCRWAFLAAGKTPIVVTEHDPFVLRGIKGWLKNKLMNRVRAIIAISEASKKTIIEQNPELAPKITVIHNGIDINEWQAEAKIEPRNEYKRSFFAALPNEKIILCVAELHERKGQKYLIEAAKILAESAGLNFKLIFVGDGPERKYYEKLAAPLKNKILFLGRRKEIAKLMSAADIFVLPSIREAFGLVLLEASAAGLPIIASDVGGIKEIIDDGKTGILVQPENAQALAEAINKLLQNPMLATSLAHEAKSKVELKFSAKTMAGRTMEVYDKALECRM
ncbi:glycosyltransferase family 4 protein [Candidatus Peregrinibacteria bacterium]|nr:glycosyltransferase family 4 protein [Candidatus Peregrinibacteria bacterium]